jgi:hypothetical protein
MAADQIEVIKQFVKICKENTDILHQPETAFFREFWEGFDSSF